MGNLVCKKCGVPRSYYTSNEHASRPSCSGNRLLTNKMDYHEWSTKICCIYFKNPPHSPS